MYFRILGPLEVHLGGVPVAVGGAKPRALLAVLLLSRGRVVPVDALAAALWGDAPPPGATSALRAYVSRVRATLEAAGDERRLHFRSGGYVLDVVDDELDAAEAQRLVTAARSADPARAVELLDDALGLWRGEALAECDGLDDARAEAARLAELRLGAAEERVDALLDLRRGREVVAELEGMVRAHPHRERPAVQLMAALCAAGRPSDALVAYHELRGRLDEELGVAPSAPAQALFRRILDRDPALDPAVPPAPGNLPRRATSFVGRAAELSGVVAALRAAPLVTLTGFGGVGKSRLALEVAGRDREPFPDGVWLCELAPLPEGGPVGHAVAAALRVQQRHGTDIDGSVVEYLRTRRLLLVLDNCEHVLDGVARLTHRIVTRCAGVAVLATSREPLGVDGEQVWPVTPLPMGDAAELFVHRARAHRPGLADEPGPVAEVCRRLDGLPLAIELAAARTRAMSVAEVAGRLDGGRLLTAGGPRGADPRHRSLAAAIDWSYELLEPAERLLFARLSVFAGGFDLAAAHHVCAEDVCAEDGCAEDVCAAGGDDRRTLDLLTGLVDRSMVVAGAAAAGTRYRMLETLRAFGRDRLREADGEAPVVLAHARYFAGLAGRAARGAQGPDERAWVAATLPDLDNLRTAFETAMACRDVGLVVAVVTAQSEIGHIRVGYESAEWAERALDLVSAEHPRHAEIVGAAARGAWNRADFVRARRLAERAGGQVPARGTGRIAYPGDVLADIALYEGDVAAARRHYEQQVAAARRDGDPLRLVWTLYYVAVCHAVLRDPDGGLAAARESVDVAGSTANPTAMSMARYALGLVGKKADPQRALALFDEAAALAAGVHNFWWRGVALMEAAATRAVHGDPVAAAAAVVEVVDHWDRVGDRTQQWLNLRYAVRLLARLDAGADAVAVHHCLVAAGKPSPLRAAHLARLLDGPGGARFAAAAARGSALTGDAAVALCRARLVAVR
ncbi:BTAD domain-containing putative transcriptional regulator [Pseudonocardia sp.]|uniref:BTAD domain-containing putative transcriptional regulator n=1 Tax=Pseudonocardia sp. TaxID=60912 RepID=UPI002604D424|nr:BTAD domain-containing putative transcriptional regulator [Pseudonocardia sp.]